MAAESPCECADAIHHHLDPPSGQAITVSVVEGGDDSLLQGFVEILRVPSIGDTIIGMARPLADSKAIGPIICFSPPPIEDATVQSAVEDGLLPAGAGGFQGAPRIIEPNVNALD